jgi:hypothetical protein
MESSLNPPLQAAWQPLICPLPFAEGIKCLALFLFLAFFRVFRGQPPLTFVFDLNAVASH